MEVFKNKVGRPSNELLKKRKQAKILIAVSVIFVIGILFYGGYSLLSVTGISKNVSANGGTIYISGKSGGFVYSKKYYASGKNITLGTTSKYSNNSNVFFFASDGNTKFNIKGTFGKKFAKSDANGYPNFIVQSYNSSGKTLETKTTQIKAGGTYTLTLTASKNIHHVRIGVLKSGKQVYNQTINVGTMPVIEHSPVSRVVKASTGEYVVQTPGEVKLKFNISNTNGHTLYYRWFTFNDYTVKSSNVTSNNNTCVAFSSKTTTKEYPFNINRPRAGVIRVYATKADCNGDTKAKYARPSSKSNNRSVLKEIVVKYRPNSVTTNSSGYTVINKYNRANLSKTIGSQTKSQCFMYALKYGAYILGRSSYTKNSTDSSVYGATNHYASNLSEIYKAIVNNVNNGKPVVIHVWNNSSDTHYVTVVGYRKDSNGNVDSLDDIWVVDPYSSSGYGKKGSNILWDGKALGRSTVKGFNSSKRYLTW